MQEFRVEGFGSGESRVPQLKVCEGLCGGCLGVAWDFRI